VRDLGKPAISAETVLTTLNCPNCGAPLQVNEGRTRTVCLYCNSTVRIQPDDSQAAVVENTLVEADMQALKRMLLAGRREDAVQLYLETTGAGEAAAREALQGLERQVSVDVMRNQQLTSKGVWYVALYGVVFLAAVLAGMAGQIHPLVALALAAFTAWQFWVLLPSIRLSLRFRRAVRAPATILKAARVGEIKARAGQVYAMKLLVEVQPPEDALFQAELLLPVRETSLEQVQPGSQFHVKYLPDDPQQIFYDR
jgi:uncharacterized Zn finger protein (UPF0148 family)